MPETATIYEQFWRQWKAAIENYSAWPEEQQWTGWQGVSRKVAEMVSLPLTLLCDSDERRPVLPDEALRGTARIRCILRNRNVLRDDMEWVRETFDELVSRYGNRYLAVRSKTVVEAADSWEDLVDLLQRKYGELNVLIIHLDRSALFEKDPLDRVSGML